MRPILLVQSIIYSFEQSHVRQECLHEVGSAKHSKKDQIMQTRKLGNSNLEVSAMGLGCMGMSFSYGPPKLEQMTGR
jgi:hypothetical protein